MLKNSTPTCTRELWVSQTNDPLKKKILEGIKNFEQLAPDVKKIIEENKIALSQWLTTRINNLHNYENDRTGQNLLFPSYLALHLFCDNIQGLGLQRIRIEMRKDRADIFISPKERAHPELWFFSYKIVEGNSYLAYLDKQITQTGLRIHTLSEKIFIESSLSQNLKNPKPQKPDSEIDIFYGNQIITLLQMSCAHNDIPQRVPQDANKPGNRGVIAVEARDLTSLVQ